MSRLSLLGKTAVVTGASGAIGRAIAVHFAREGAHTVLAGRSASRLEEALNKVKEAEAHSSAREPQQHHSIFSFDVRALQGWQSLVAEHPKIDILVNCAGQTQHELLVRSSEAGIDELLQANLRSAIWGCKTVGKRMIARRDGGCIINISSLLAQRAAIGTSVYAASKAGLLGLTTSLAQEYGRHGIRVNAIVPGYIDTAMTKGIATKADLAKRIPLQRFGTADEVADAAVFLARNQYANNCVLHLDGGLSAVV